VLQCHTSYVSHGFYMKFVTFRCVAVCCSVLPSNSWNWHTASDYFVCGLHCVALFGSVLQCVAVCCRVLQSVAVCCSVLTLESWHRHAASNCVALIAAQYSLQCVAVCCSVLQCVAMSNHIALTLPNSSPALPAECGSVLQHVAACCSVLQCQIVLP